jgi:hypothetical protein
LPVDPAGVSGPTPGEARGPRHRRTSYGLYVPVGVEPTGPQRTVEAAATLRAGVVTGRAGLGWLGCRWFRDGPSGPVTLVLQGNEGRSRQGDLVTVSQEFLHPDEVLRVDGLRVTTAMRSVAYEMRYAGSDLEAAQVFAMAAYDDMVSIDEVARYCELVLPRCTGVQRVRDVIPRLVEDAWSPTEVTMGWLWSDEVPGAVVLHNRPVFDLRGRHVATVDGIDERAGVVGEYYGALHLAGRQRPEDVVREDLLRSLGLEVVVMLGPDLRDPAPFRRRLRSAYDRAGRSRQWTLEQPGWWIDTSTVRARRALTGEHRDRLLRYRRAA